MATNGRVDSTNYEGRFISFIWTLQSQSSKSNTSTITWRLEGGGTAESTRYKAGNFKVVIDGVTVYSTPQDSRIWLYNGTVVTSGTYSFTHDAEGKKSFSVSIQAGIYTYAVNCTGNGSFTLPTIARASTINSVSGNTINDTLKVNYNYYVSNYINNLLVKLDSATLQTISSYKSNEEFSLSEFALSSIYTATTSSNTVNLTFTLETYDGNVLIGSNSVNKTLTVNDSNPTIASLSYADINSNTIAVTGDNQYIIRNKSELQLTVSNIAARNGATLSTITITGGGIDNTRAISGTSISSEVFNFGAINQSGDFTLTATVTDSRGYTVSQSINVLVYDYTAPTATISAGRVDNYYTTTNVTANATYSSIGGNNTLNITAQFKKTTDASYGAAVTLTNGVTKALSLDNQYEWNLKVTVADALSATIYNLVIGRGLPIWFIDRVLNSIGINCFPTQEDSLEVNGLRLDDNIYIGSQQIYDSFVTTAAGDTTLACAYEYKLIEGIFADVTIPSGYKKAYKVTFQFSTANNNILVVSLNNINSNECNTWSNDNYRHIGYTDIFTEDDIVLEEVNGTQRTGINLTVSNSGAYSAKVWAITIHGYIVKS